MHTNGLTKTGADHHPLGVVDKDEEILADIRRHPIGLITLYLLTGIGLFGAYMVIGLVLPGVLQVDVNANYVTLAISMIVFVTVLVLLGLFVATYVYRQSHLMVTDKNITQIIQYSLFSRKTSQLSMNNVEDVTAEQRGIIASIFNYGTLKAETAGEQANFHFIYCPYPNVVAKEILEARERYIEHPKG